MPVTNIPECNLYRSSSCENNYSLKSPHSPCSKMSALNFRFFSTQHSPTEPFHSFSAIIISLSILYVHCLMISYSPTIIWNIPAFSLIQIQHKTMLLISKDWRSDTHEMIYFLIFVCHLPDELCITSTEPYKCSKSCTVTPLSLMAKKILLPSGEGYH